MPGCDRGFSDAGTFLGQSREFRRNNSFRGKLATILDFRSNFNLYSHVGYLRLRLRPTRTLGFCWNCDRFNRCPRSGFYGANYRCKHESRPFLGASFGEWSLGIPLDLLDRTNCWSAISRDCLSSFI